MTEELLNEFLSIDIKEILCLKKQPQGNLEDCLKLLDKNQNRSNLSQLVECSNRF